MPAAYITGNEWQRKNLFYPIGDDQYTVRVYRTLYVYLYIQDIYKKCYCKINLS